MKTKLLTSATGYLIAAMIGCGAPPLDSDLTEVATSTAALSLPTPLALPKGPISPLGPLLISSPFKGIVGRGFNHRVPVTRLDFTPGDLFTSSGRWDERLATDRGLCVEFASGVSNPTSEGYDYRLRATIVKGNKSFALAANGEIKASNDINVVVPIEGVPVPAGANTSDEVGFEGVAKASSSASVASIFALASAPVVKGLGAARLRTSIVDSITSLPAAERAGAFFRKCGDSFLDDIRLGGFLALDITLEATESSGVLKVRQKLERGLSLANLGDGETADDTDAVASLDGLMSLLNSLGVEANAKVGSEQNVSVDGSAAKLMVNARSMGPILPDDLTIANAIDLARTWGNYVASHKSDLAPMEATLKLYAGVDKAEALGIPLPGFVVDTNYDSRMEELNGYLVHHLAVRAYFSSMEKLLQSVASADLFFPAQGVLPNAGEASTQRLIASNAVTAILLSQQCMSALPPGYSNSQFAACRNQDPDDADGPAASIDVVAQGNGAYRLYKRIGEVVIAKTWDDLHQPLQSMGYSASFVSTQDISAWACGIKQVDNDVVFWSGESDDGLPWTDSICFFDLWDPELRSGWKVVDTDWLAFGNPEGPETVGFPTNKLRGTVKVDHRFLSKGAGLRLKQVVLRGPIDVVNDFELARNERDIDFAVQD